MTGLLGLVSRRAAINMIAVARRSFSSSTRQRGSWNSARRQEFG